MGIKLYVCAQWVFNMNMHVQQTCFTIKSYGDVISPHCSAPSGAPQNFIAMPSSRSITFSWDPPLPADRNGDITRYTITCSDGSESHTADFTEAGSGMIDGLTPFTSYSCSITASNSAGTGPSSVISVSTMEAGESYYYCASVIIQLLSYMCYFVTHSSW